MLREVRDAEEVRQSVAAEVLEAHQAVAADVAGGHVPADELPDLACQYVQDPHAAVRFDGDLPDPVAVHVNGDDGWEAGVLVEVVAPALTGLGPGLSELQQCDVPEVFVRRVGVLTDHDLLARDLGQVVPDLHGPVVGHGVDVVAEAGLAGGGVHQHRGSEGLCRAPRGQGELDAAVAVQVFGGDQALEVEAGGVRLPQQ